MKESEHQLSGPADAEKELEFLLSYNGIQAEKTPEGYRFLLSAKGVKWEMLLSPTEDGAVLLYSFYPFRVTEREEAEAFCQRVNRQARYGAMVLDGDRLLYRIGADLFDTYSAYETLGRALEYSAGIMVRFWVQAGRTAK